MTLMSWHMGRLQCTIVRINVGETVFELIQLRVLHLSYLNSILIIKSSRGQKGISHVIKYSLIISAGSALNPEQVKT
jgi:hypothetical protein